MNGASHLTRSKTERSKSRWWNIRWTFCREKRTMEQELPMTPMRPMTRMPTPSTDQQNRSSLMSMSVEVELPVSFISAISNLKNISGFWIQFLRLPFFPARPSFCKASWLLTPAMCRSIKEFDVEIPRLFAITSIPIKSWMSALHFDDYNTRTLCWNYLRPHY